MPAYGAFAARQAAALDFQPMDHMQEYLEQLEAEQRHPAYVRQVRSGLHHLSEFLRGENVLSVEEITRLHLIRFQAHCNMRVNSGEWKKSYSIQILKKVRAWINWLDACKYITSNPWREIRVGQVKKTPKPLSEDDLAALFAEHVRQSYQPNLDPFIWHRRDIILVLLYGMALRLNELTALTEAQMDMRADFVDAKNKSTASGARKGQPYTPFMKDAVARYLTQRARYATREHGALLITQNGTPMTDEQVRYTIYELGAAAGVKVNPHQLRDTVGTDMLDGDIPVERVQKLYGHSNQAMTLAYAQVRDRKVYETVANFVDPRLEGLFHSTRELAGSR